MSTEVMVQKGGVRVIAVTPEDGTFAGFIEELDSVIDEAISWQEVCKTQKRVKSLRGSNLSDVVHPKTKTRKGYKKALNDLDRVSVQDELESYQSQLADALSCRRELIDEIFETSTYLANISADRYAEVYKELAYLESIQKLLDYADKELIPELQESIRSLSIVKKEDTKKLRKIRSSNYKDKVYGRRNNVRRDQAYKRNRDIARMNKNAKKYAFA